MSTPAEDLQAIRTAAESFSTQAAAFVAQAGSILSYDGGTLLDLLDQAKTLATYGGLRVYSGRAKQIRITQNRISGLFTLDTADTTSVDNGGTCIVDGLGRRWKRVFEGAILDCWFGAVGDAVADDTVPVQKAIDAACPPQGSGFAGKVILTGKRGYRITDTIDITNTRQAGSLSRDGLQIECSSSGGGAFTGAFFGYTGDGKAVVEITGSQFLRMDLWIMSGPAPASGQPDLRSTIGIYQGLSIVLPQTQNQVLRGGVVLHSNPAANNGSGTIGLWNFGAEENTYSSYYLNADHALVMTVLRNGVCGEYQHPKQPQMEAHSLGMSAFTGECFIVSLNRYFAPVTLQGVNSWMAQNMYISNIDTVAAASQGTNTEAFALFSNNSGMTYNGTIEQMAMVAHLYDTVRESSFRVVFGGLPQTNGGTNKTPMFRFERGGGGRIENCTFDIADHPGENLDRDLFDVVLAGPTERVSCYVANSTFKVPLNLGHTGLQENLLWNPKTRNVTITGPDWGYEILDHKHRITFADYPLSTSGVSVELLKIRMPRAFPNLSAGNCLLELAGLVTTTFYGDGARSSGKVRAEAMVVTDNLGNQYYSTPALALTSVVSVNPAGNTLTGVGMSVSPVANQTSPNHISVALTPTVTGANASSCSFTGSAEMTWSGWYCAGPAMMRSGQTSV